MTSQTKYYDVNFTIYVNCYEKTGWSRVLADNPLEAVISAIEGEQHNLDLDEEEVQKQVMDEYDGESVIGISVCDNFDFTYEITDVIELRPVPTQLDGETVYILLPVEERKSDARLQDGRLYYMTNA